MKKIILKRIISSAVVAVLSATLLIGCNQTPPASGDYVPNETTIKPLGRYYLDEKYEDMMWFSLSASGVEFDYENCTTCSLDLVGDLSTAPTGQPERHPRYAVYVNGERVVDQLLDASKVTIEVPLKEKTGTVRLVKLSESSDSTMGICGIHVDGTISPSKEKDLKIEFIGDSITCGYGVDGTLDNSYSPSLEDATKTYAYKTAEALNADYSMVSYSGHGIISGYTSNDQPQEKQKMELYYTKFGNSYQKLLSNIKPVDVDWDFSKFTPDYIVINLGTNDASYCKNAERKEKFCNGYVAFLKLVRENNPNAHIICTLGIMGGDLFPNIEEAVNRYSLETGDNNVSAMKFDLQTAPYAVDYHPTEASHAVAAEKLTAYIQSLEKQ